MNVKKTLLALATIGLVVSTSSCGPAKVYRPAVYEWGSTYAKLREGQGYHEPFSKVREKDSLGNTRTGYKVTNVKALVCPIDFTDYPADDPNTAVNEEEALIQELNTAVFGEPEDTRWHSLRSYYEEASFGQCIIRGQVVPTFHTGVTASDLELGKKFGYEYKAGGFDGATHENASKRIANEVRNLYAPGGARYGQLDLEDFDANNDGYIDSLILIYTRPERRQSGSSDEPNLYWAFRWTSGGVYREGQPPAASSFFWASRNFLYEGGAEKVDCHTLIHEFGHILSLPDYYNYDYNGTMPSAGLDMMDYNIGDHNALSKSWLGWTTPYVVEGKGTFTLNSTTRTGDYLLIPVKGKWNDYHNQSKEKFNGTLLSQFLMIEFITPEGVAKADGERPYTDGWALYYSNAGVRIWHVDARIGQFSSSTGAFQGYTVATSGSNGVYVDLATSNTTSEINNNSPLLTLLKPGYKLGGWKTRGVATNDDLFYAGDSLNGYKFFNDNGVQNVSVGYNISVVKINGNESAVIKLS